MKGWVYIIVSESMPNLLKVGYSTKDPDERAKELGNTGNPCKYEVVYEILLYEPKEVEKQAHNLLKEMDLWVNKEWFECSLRTARRAILCSAIYGVFYEDLRITGNFNTSEGWFITWLEKYWKSKIQNPVQCKISVDWLTEVFNEVIKELDAERIAEHDDGSLYRLIAPTINSTFKFQSVVNFKRAINRPVRPRFILNWISQSVTLSTR